MKSFKAPWSFDSLHGNNPKCWLCPLYRDTWEPPPGNDRYSLIFRDLDPSHNKILLLFLMHSFVENSIIRNLINQFPLLEILIQLF